MQGKLSPSRSLAAAKGECEGMERTGEAVERHQPWGSGALVGKVTPEPMALTFLLGARPRVLGTGIQYVKCFFCGTAFVE